MQEPYWGIQMPEVLINYSFLSLTLHIKGSFPLSISSVNVTKSTGNCGFGHIY